MTTTDSRQPALAIESSTINREADVDDTAFIAKLRAGDELAFEALVSIAWGRMMAVARPFMIHDEDTQDAVQDAFLSALKGLPAFDGRSRLTTWLHRITVNACLMRLRTKRRRPEKLINDLRPRFQDDGHHWEPVAPWKPEQTDALEREEYLELMREKIAELPGHYRAVLALRDGQGLDTAAAARVLQTSPTIVKIRLHRARQALRTLINDQMSST